MVKDIKKMVMKLYDYPGAPNPRRVKIFAAEKGIDLDLVLCDMSKREHKSTEFLILFPLNLKSLF